MRDFLHCGTGAGRIGLALMVVLLSATGGGAGYADAQVVKRFRVNYDLAHRLGVPNFIGLKDGVEHYGREHCKPIINLLSSRSGVRIKDGVYTCERPTQNKKYVLIEKWMPEAWLETCTVEANDHDKVLVRDRRNLSPDERHRMLAFAVDASSRRLVTGVTTVLKDLKFELSPGDIFISEYREPWTAETVARQAYFSVKRKRPGGNVAKANVYEVEPHEWYSIISGTAHESPLESSVPSSKASRPKASRLWRLFARE